MCVYECVSRCIYYMNDIIYRYIYMINIILLKYDDDDDDIEFISTKIGPCRPLRSCGKKIIIK